MEQRVAKLEQQQRELNREVGLLSLTVDKYDEQFALLNLAVFGNEDVHIDPLRAVVQDLAKHFQEIAQSLIAIKYIGIAVIMAFLIMMIIFGIHIMGAI